MADFNILRPGRSVSYLARLRQTEPISCSQLPDCWVLTLHDGYREALLDNVRFSNDPTCIQWRPR